MIDGESIRLRPWKEADLGLLGELRNDLALQAQLLARPRGSSEPQLRQWLESRARDADGLFLVVADRADDTALGYLQIDRLSPVDRRAELGICLHAAAQGRGIGRQALGLVQAYLLRVWALRKLTLQVRSDNAAAIACYQHAGFRNCGLLSRHHWADGAFHDVVLMECFLGDEGAACAS
jgi:diamine N-acetyltransferase